MFRKYLRLKYLVLPVISAVVMFGAWKISEAYFSKEIRVVNNTVVGKKLNVRDKQNIKTMVKKANHSSDSEEMYKMKEISFYFDGQPLNFQGEIWQKAQRYYLPIQNITRIIGGGYSENDNNITINYKNNVYIIDKKQCLVKCGQEDSFSLRGNLINKDGKMYVSLSDIEHIFNLIDNWDLNQKKISLHKSKKIIKRMKANYIGTAALIRLEDVAAGDIMIQGENLQKMKIIADYLYSEGVKFNVAWIPRYKDPEKNIDNNLLEINNMQNAQFISMLDYMIFRGGVIGLHGYTHQHDNEKSIVSVEISDKFNSDAQTTTKIIQSAIDTADKLNIPITFFETPHYAATELQQSVIEQYFNYIYEPYIGVWNKMPVVSLRNKTTIYVPAPLSYVKGNDVQTMINSIKNRENGTLASFFYHPSKEFDFINLNIEDNGYINYTYSAESHMHKLVKTLKDNKYTTVNINEIN